MGYNCDTRANDSYPWGEVAQWTNDARESVARVSAGSTSSRPGNTLEWKDAFPSAGYETEGTPRGPVLPPDLHPCLPLQRRVSFGRAPKRSRFGRCQTLSCPPATDPIRPRTSREVNVFRAATAATSAPILQAVPAARSGPAVAPARSAPAFPAGTSPRRRPHEACRRRR